MRFGRVTHFSAIPLLNILGDRQDPRARCRTWTASLCLGVCLAFAGPAEAKTYSLLGNKSALQRVRVVVEVRGELKLNADGEKVERLPLTVQGELTYEEKRLDLGAGKESSLRYYRQAEAKLGVGQTTRTATLDEEHRLIRVQATPEKAVVFSPNGPMTRDELELVDVPANSALAQRLLPREPVEVKQTWSCSAEVLAAVLGLDAVSRTTVKSQLTNVEDNVAMVTLAGEVDGAVGGVATSIDLKGRCNFDLSKQHLTWLALSVKENRSIGHAEPGFEVSARVRMLAEPIEESKPLSPAVLAGLPLEMTEASTLLRFQAAKAHFQMLQDRRWRAMVDRHESTILRYVKRGDLIAQCNITCLPDLPAGSKFTMEAFQSDIRKGLGKNFGQIVEAGESTTEGLHVMRVVAIGEVSELPIQWNYYHLADEKGRQASCVFTLESALTEKFAEADQVIVGSFEFTPRPTPQAAPRAEKAAEHSAQSGPESPVSR